MPSLYTNHQISQSDSESPPINDDNDYLGSLNYKNAAIAVLVTNIAHFLLGSDTTTVFNRDAPIETDEPSYAQPKDSQLDTMPARYNVSKLC